MRAVAVMVLAAAIALPQGKRTISDAEVARIHKSALIIDTHNDTPTRIVNGGFDIALPNKSATTDLPRLQAGNIGAVFFSAYVPRKHVKTHDSAAFCRRIIEVVRNDIVGKHPADFTLATTAAEIEAAHKQGKIAALIGIEGGHAIEDSVDKLREFYRLGARYMTLTHSNTNDWADSSGDKGKHGGLTKFGREVVLEMNRLGMMVDISHVADNTFRDVLAVTKAPVIASHSSCRAISGAKRNMTDDMLRALGKNGGVIHINFACGFLNDEVRKDHIPQRRALSRKYGDNMGALRLEIEERFKRATLDDVVENIDHAVQLAGIDHVGIGSDYDGVDCTPKGLEDYSKFPALTRALLERGYTEEQIGKIYGGNTLRLMRSVEKVAASMKK